MKCKYKRIRFKEIKKVLVLRNVYVILYYFNLFYKYINYKLINILNMYINYILFNFLFYVFLGYFNDRVLLLFFQDDIKDYVY